MSKKWIQKAVKKEGSFTKWCKAHGCSGVTKSCIAKAKEIAKKTGNKSLLGKATLAYRFKYGDLAKSNK